MLQGALMLGGTQPVFAGQQIRAQDVPYKVVRYKAIAAAVEIKKNLKMAE